MLYANWRDSRWSEAEQIARAQFFFPHGRSGLRVDRDGILHFAFSSFSGDFIPVHLRRVGQDWTLGVIPGYDGPDFSHGQDIGYESLVLGPGERLSLAYTSGARSARDPTLRGQPNHVFFRGSEDGGRTWNDPVLVMPSRGRPAMQLQLVRTRGDTLHLVWVRAPRGGTPIAESIEHVYSADGRLTWSESDRMPLPTGLRGIGTLAAMADPDGELHVTFRAPTTEPHQVIWHSRLEDGRLTGPVPLLPDSRRIGNYAMAIDDEGRKHVVWAHAAPWLETDPPGYPDLRLSYTVQTPCADPAPPP